MDRAVIAVETETTVAASLSPTLADLRALVQERLGLSVDEVTPDARLREDLGFDSLDLMELAIAAERRFHIEIPEEQLAIVHTMADVVTLIETLAGVEAKT